MKELTSAANPCRLTEIAEACNNGACNSYALIGALAEAVKDLEPWEVQKHPVVKVVLGQLTWLSKESIGPSAEALTAYRQWRKEEKVQ